MKSQFHFKATPVAYGSQRVLRYIILHIQETLANMHVAVADELSRCSECALTYICYAWVFVCLFKYMGGLGAHLVPASSGQKMLAPRWPVKQVSRELTQLRSHWFIFNSQWMYSVLPISTPVTIGDLALDSLQVDVTPGLCTGAYEGREGASI